MVKHGIDVSKFQGVIDWQEVKKHIDFAIIRCGYGSDDENQDDPFFKRNADECTRLKIPFGIYIRMPQMKRKHCRKLIMF